MELSAAQSATSQPAETKSRKTGKARRISELPLMAHKLIPAEYAQGIDIEELAAEWNAYPAVIERVCLLSLLRRVQILEDRRLLAVMRRAA